MFCSNDIVSSETDESDVNDDGDEEGDENDEGDSEGDSDVAMEEVSVENGRASTGILFSYEVKLSRIQFGNNWNGLRIWSGWCFLLILDAIFGLSGNSVPCVSKAACGWTKGICRSITGGSWGCSQWYVKRVPHCCFQIIYYIVTVQTNA